MAEFYVHTFQACLLPKGDYIKNVMSGLWAPGWDTEMLSGVGDVLQEEHSLLLANSRGDTHRLSNEHQKILVGQKSRRKGVDMQWQCQRPGGQKNGNAGMRLRSWPVRSLTPPLRE